MIFHLQPTLTGELIQLRPLRREDFDELFGAASDPLIWEQHPEPDRYTRPVFQGYFDGAMESGGAFAIIERKSGRIIGSSRYCNLEPERSEVEVGWTFLERAFWGGPYNRELKRLMLNHAFRFVERVVFVVGVSNMRSQRALEKLGARLARGTERPRRVAEDPTHVAFVITRADWQQRSGARHIGIVGCSTEGAALCYRTISLYGAERMGAHAHPPVSLHSFSLADYMTHVRAGDWQRVGELMLASAGKLASIGADVLICPDNTCHIAWPFVEPRAPLPWLHITDVVAREAQRRGFRRIAITGTRYTMEGPVYRERLGAFGIDAVAPNEEERAEIDRIIFDELVYGRTEPAALAYFQRVIERLALDGCDAVVLGCTEIPLLVGDHNSPLPTLDSTRLLARAAVDYALAEIAPVAPPRSRAQSRD